jgi:hypothetical protein
VELEKTGSPKGKLVIVPTHRPQVSGFAQQS